jgi:hypothetical protein
MITVDNKFSLGISRAIRHVDEEFTKLMNNTTRQKKINMNGIAKAYTDFKVVFPDIDMELKEDFTADEFALINLNYAIQSFLSHRTFKDFVFYADNLNSVLEITKCYAQGWDDEIYMEWNEDRVYANQ